MADQPNPNGPARREIPWWLLAIALLGVLTAWAIVADQSYSQIFRALASGIITTLWVALVAFFCACVIGLVIAMGRTSALRVLREMTIFYIEIVRGIPILVALFYVAFVGAPWLVDAINWVTTPLIALGWAQPVSVRNLDFTWRAILALSVCYSAFIAEILRAGIQAVDHGQIEAGRALGLSPWRIFRHIISPQAMRIILPPLGNDFVSMIKDSALVSALGVQDITQLGKVYSSSTFKFFETYNVVAFLYLVMTISLSLGVRMIERRMNRSRHDSEH